MVTLFAIARAFGALISTLVTRGQIPYIQFSETALFSLCCGFLVYAVALNPQLLYTGYYYSVLKWSRDYTDKKLNVLFRNPGPKFLTCSEVGLHEDSCTRHAFKDFFQSIPAFAKLYFPIHVTPVVIFRRKLLLERWVGLVNRNKLWHCKLKKKRNIATVKIFFTTLNTIALNSRVWCRSQNAQFTFKKNKFVTNLGFHVILTFTTCIPFKF